MIQRHGKWMADWRDTDGQRKRKAFVTIAEALLWKQQRRRAIPRLSQTERKTRRLRTRSRSAKLCDLRRIWTSIRRRKKTDRYYYLDSIIGPDQLRSPTFRVIDRNGRVRTEKWETADKLIERLGLA